MHVEKTSFNITDMARLLGVSRPGYYAWTGQEPSPAEVRRARIERKVASFHENLDEAYGSPRILADLRADGKTVSRKTIAKAMRSLG